MRRHIRALLSLPLTALIAALAPAPAAHGAGAGATDTFIGTWAAPPTAVPAADSTVYEEQTLRQRVHLSVAGTSVRVRFTNEFGTTPLAIGEAHAAHPAADGPATAIDAGTDRELRFDGSTSTTLAPGTQRWSDPVELPTTAGGDLVISLYLPQPTPADTTHSSAYQSNFVADGDVTGKPDLTPTSTTTSWHFLSGVAVNSADGAADSALVTLGDSITDGEHTTMDANRRWPDLLAERLRSDKQLAPTGVVNAGIGGNRLLRDPNPVPGSPAESFAAYFGESGLKRFDRDVLGQPGARAVTVFLGVNDLGSPGIVAPASEEVTAPEIIEGYRKLIQRAHEHDLKILGATILPFEGDTLGYYTPQRESVRQAVNAWIRTSGAFDGVADLDAAVRDPDRPGRLLPAYNGGDGLHPNDAGMAAMARAFPLQLLR
ncbi:SGNH/GDSL hydrolase family protein (plasmid) [Streptomyces sp. NBC_01224]|uniref:SGNH/GDSL hydrolase family protein n=1 Tax=unclassified Streptomyces TaxID=2593676 RepID=UPI002E0E381A|nr:SGNH/GDSL hydrolase family protein [Streptomyces sp. NBC_01224]